MALSLFNDPFLDVMPTFARSSQQQMSLGACDVIETANSHIIKVDVAGIKGSDLAVDVEGDVLTIRGERKHEKEEEGSKFHRMERSYGSFQRSFRLPQDVDESKISADNSGGTLTITLPKSKQPKSKKSSVQIRSVPGG